MSAAKNGKTAKEQKAGTYVQVERGIYRYKDLAAEITYHERPWIIGKNGKPGRTYKTLGVNFTRQTNLNAAREEYQRRRTEVAAGRNPYEEKTPEVKPDKPTDKPTVSRVIKTYVEANYPDRYLKARKGRTLEAEKANCETLLTHWDGQPWDSIMPHSWDDYHDKRIVEINGQAAVDAWKLAEKIAQKEAKAVEAKPLRGDRAVDLERNTLLSAYKYSFRKNLITGNPVAQFPRFHPTSAVKHCREFKPESADELHVIAGLLFSKRSTEALAWQLLFEANTALRTSEVLMLRMDAKPGKPGYIDEQDNMSVHRCKGGINPFVHVNNGLKVLLKFHTIWHALRYPNNPYFIPGKKAGEPMKRRALSHALGQLRAKIGRKITSHGMRAFYVLVRRSWGIKDDVIAVELGQGSGAGLIATTYGDVPANWRNGGGPKLSWLPADPAKYAWAELEKNGWKPAKEQEEQQKAR